MKVVHLALTDGGGAGMGMMNQHRALRAMGIDSRVVVAQKRTADPWVAAMQPNLHIWGRSRVMRLLQRAACRWGICFNDYDRWHHRIYQVRKKHPADFSQPFSQYGVLQHPWVAEADIVNLHYVSGFLDWPTFFGQVRQPVVWTLRDENPGLGGFHYEEALRRCGAPYAALEEAFIGVKRRALRQCRHLHLVSLSHLMQQFCARVDFLAERPNSLIPNTLSPENYRPVHRDEARMRLRLQPDDRVLAFVSCHLAEERKGLALLLQAMRLLGDDRLTLLCVGRGEVPDASPLRVVNLGPMADPGALSSVYAAADAFVNASSQESFGKTVVEALYCGTPVVSTPTGIAPEVIDSSNGVLCLQRTPEALAEAIGEVLRRSYSSSDIRRKAVEQFSPQGVAARYAQLYQSILQA